MAWPIDKTVSTETALAYLGSVVELVTPILHCPAFLPLLVVVKSKCTLAACAVNEGDAEWITTGWNNCRFCCICQRKRQGNTLGVVGNTGRSIICTNKSRCFLYILNWKIEQGCIVSKVVVLTIKSKYAKGRIIVCDIEIRRIGHHFQHWRNRSIEILRILNKDGRNNAHYYLVAPDLAETDWLKQSSV